VVPEGRREGRRVGRREDEEHGQIESPGSTDLIGITPLDVQIYKFTCRLAGDELGETPTLPFQIARTTMA
jgi:hypothetical protein